MHQAGQLSLAPQIRLDVSELVVKAEDVVTKVALGQVVVEPWYADLAARWRYSGRTLCKHARKLFMMRPKNGFL